MKKRPVLFWVVIAVVAFVCVFVGVYMTLRIFLGDPKSLPPTVILSPTAIFSPTSKPPTNTPLPSATRVVATLIPGLTNTPTVAPSATSVPPTAKSSPTTTAVPPTAKPSLTATAVPPTVKPSATHVPPTAKSSPTATAVPPTAKPSLTATAVPPTVKPSATHVPPTATHVPPTPTVNPIQNINWQWISLMDEGTPSIVPHPADYTLIFNSDGTLNGKADCNSFKGTYSQKNGLTISISSSTTAFCGEGSLDTMYLSLLGSVVAGGPDGAGGLALETAGGAQRMTFSK